MLNYQRVTRAPLLVEISLKMGQQKYVHHPRRFPIRKMLAQLIVDSANLDGVKKHV